MATTQGKFSVFLSLKSLCIPKNCRWCMSLNTTSICLDAPGLLMNTPVPSMTKSTPISPQGSLVGSRFETTRMDLPSTLMCSSSTSLTSAGNVPKIVSYLSRWLACLTPPESFSATTSRLEFSRPCQQRRKLRPIRPNPLMPTLIFCSETVNCLLPVVPCNNEQPEVRPLQQQLLLPIGERRHSGSYCGGLSGHTACKSLFLTSASECVCVLEARELCEAGSGLQHNRSA